MLTPRPLCLVSPLHLANNPRVVKEATALQTAGFAVTVIHGRFQPHLVSEDRAIAASHDWHSQPVDWRRRPGSLPMEMNHRLARLLLRVLPAPSLRLAARAEHRAARALAAAAARVPASLYIGHTPAGLCAAADAARRNRGRLGFDAEDYHPAETDSVLRNAWRQRGLHTIEKHLLPACVSLTASSPLIGARYALTYRLRSPSVVHNAFPRCQAPAAPRAPRRGDGRRPRLYWFSQTIGHGRGLEELLVALGRAKVVCDVHLRGKPEGGFVEALHRLAAAAQYRGRLHILPRAPASDLVRLCADHDLGLALENTTPLNRDLCLTNKLFVYLLAGVPVAYTPTTAQRRFASSLGSAALEIDLRVPDNAAASLDAYFEDAPRQRQARAAAWSAGQTSWCWDTEQSVLIEEVTHALTQPLRNIPRV